MRTQPMIRVRPAVERPYAPDLAASHQTRIRRAWSVWMAGLRLPGWYVVDTPTGLTIIRDGAMVTNWHAGIGPGDLARLVVPRVDAR